MPKPNIELEFSQGKFLKYARQYDSKNKIINLFFNKTNPLKKMVTWNGVDYSISEGYCYGFSNAFLSYSSINKESDYLERMNKLIGIINDKTEHKNAYDKIKLKSLKIHAGVLLNNLMKEVIYTQRIESDSAVIYDNSLYKYSSPIGNRNFIKYMNDSIDEGFSLYKKYRENDQNKHSYADHLSKLQKLKIKKFYDALNTEFNELEKSDYALFSDPWFKQFYERFSNKREQLEKSFNISDANFAKDMIMKSIDFDNYQSQYEINKTNGVELDSGYHNYQERLAYRNEIKLSEFVNEISEYTKNSKSKLLFEVKAPNHSMALVVNYDQKTQRWVYYFFDSNYGVFRYYDENSFKVFINDFVLNQEKYYGFKRLDDGDYTLAFTKYNVSQSQRAPLIELNVKNIQITENVLLAESKEIIYLDYGKKNKLIYQDFYHDSNMVKIKAKLNGEVKYILTDIMNVTNLSEHINENIDSLSKISSDIFISKSGSKIYSINLKQDINRLKDLSIKIERGSDGKFEQFYDSEMKKLFGNPIAQLDTGFDDVYFKYVKQHDKVLLAGEQSLTMDTIDKWLDPMVRYRLNKALDAETDRAIKPTKYSYNVIIQLEGDNASTNATANAFSKHPDDSMVIQYDIKTKQYKILHGELSRLNTGHVRWTTIGHGVYQGDHQSTLYAGVNAQQFSDGIYHLQKKVLNNSKPAKFVLMGCNLGRGGIDENFALKATLALSEHNMKMPITAYNRFLKNIYLGNKFVLSETGNYDSIPTKDHKFIYQFNTNTQQIDINKNASVLYFINQLRQGEIKLSQLENSFELDPLASFRHAETRALDLDLIKKVAYNPNAYKLFKDTLGEYNGDLPDSFHHDFSKQLNRLGMTAIPIWEMVDSSHITKTALKHPVQVDTSLSVIVRLVGTRESKQTAEKLAARNPENTLILQMDTDNKKWTIEYGDSHIPSLLESQKNAQWVVIGDAATLRKPQHNLVSGLVSVKNKYPFASPDHILFHSLGPDMITTGAEHQQFTANLSAKLKLQGIEAPVVSKYAYTKTTTPVQRVTVATHEVLGGKADNSPLLSLLEKIALKEIRIEDIRLIDHPYLDGYFTDENGRLDKQKLKSAVYDPLFNLELNRYLNGKENSLVNDIWLPKSYPQQAEQIHALLSGIKDDLFVLNCLSPRSKKLLQTLFPDGDGIDNGKILDVVTDNNKFLLLSEKLVKFSQLGAHNFEGKDATLKNITFADAFKLYDAGNTQRLQQYNHLINKQKISDSGYQVGLVNHGVVRPSQSSYTWDQSLGTVYGIEYGLTDVHSARNLIERQAQLEEGYLKNTLSPTEETLLMEIRKYNRTLNNVVSREGISVTDQPVNNLFSSHGEIKNGITFLRGTQAAYTVIFRERNGIHEYCLFDPLGTQFSVKHESRQSAMEHFQQQVRNYFAQNIQLADGQQVSRGEAAGFNVMNNGDFRANIQFVDLDAGHVKARLSDSLNMRSLIHQHEAFVIPNNFWIELGGEKIAFAKLQSLGATVDGKPLSMKDFSIDNLHQKIRFSPEKLTLYFTLMEGDQDDLAFIKIFNEQINSKDIYQLVDHDGRFAETAILKKQLHYLANGIDIQQDSFPVSVLQKMQNVGVKLPRYQRIANRFGQGMGAAGAIQCVISAGVIANRLDNPDLTEKEIKELEKQFYLLCASAFFNYGDMVLQPMLLNVASMNGATSLLKARLAAGVMVVFNLVGMGLDAYQAYDNLSKLDTVTDPKQRQDLIVNASFAIASCIVSGVVVVGVLIGASTVPVVGLVIGGILIVGGWVYNGVRAVENIKQVIDIDWDRELEEGIRGALGIEPTLRTQQEMNASLYIDAFKQQDWNMNLAQFEQQLLPAGFDQHFSIVENPIQQSERRFYLVDGYGNYFYGELDHSYPMYSKALPFTSKKGAPSFTESDADFIIENRIYKQGRWFRNLRDIYRSNGLQREKDFSIKKEAKDVHDYVRAGSEPTNEMYFLDPNYQNPLLERFKTRFRIPDVYTQSSIRQQLMVSSPEQISLFSRKKKYGVSEAVVAQNVSQGEQFINDRDRIGWYLEDKNSAGTSWNTANGNDVVIGYADQKNAFQVLSGEKYFAGGKHDDLFYIRDGDLVSLNTTTNKQPTKYLDGQAGVDTVIVDTLPKQHNVYANLAKNTLNYKKEGNYPFVPVANLQNIENFIVKGSSNDSLRGNSEDNILDGGNGKDLLVGESGNDKLILTQGTAIGGEGDDYYHIRRYKWFEAPDSLYASERYWDRREKKVKVRTQLHPVYLKMTKKYDASVVIDETSKSQSTISLEYSFNEIERVVVDGEDLHLIVKLPSAKVDGKTYDNIDSMVTIVLKNAIREHEDQKLIHHQYRVQTQDGFVMETRLEESKPNQYFAIRYVESADKMATSEHKIVKIDEALNTISVDENRHHIAPDWGWFTHVGGAKQLEYRGNAQNNMLPFLLAGSHIQVSRGVDTYQIVQTKPDDREITFDFSAVNSQFTEEDKVILLLPNENGYLLQMDGLNLQRVDKQGKVQLNIHFTQVGNDLEDAVLIQDKHSNLFSVNLKTHTLSPLNPVSESTDNQDVILLPAGYQSPQAVVNGKQGDDIIIDRSGFGHILAGGEGDDKLLAFEGENVLYGAKDDDMLSVKGTGKNVFISLEGEDNLSGGKGDDLYIISAHGGDDGNDEVIVSDMEGHNQVVLIDFDPYSVSHHKISDEMTETRYQSENGRRVTIRHNNLLESKDNVMAFKHLNGYQSLSKANVESTVDRLVQLLAEQHLAYDSSFEPSADNKNSRYQWGAVQTTERFFNQLS